MITRLCPHCGVEGPFGLGTEERLFDPADESLIHLEICRNPDCGGAVAVVTKGVPAREAESFPGRAEPVEDMLPFGVKTAYAQARRSLRFHIYDAAVLLCVRSLQEAVQELGAKGKSLEDQIVSVTRDERTLQALREWAQSNTLRSMLQAQGAGSSRSEAQEVMEFCERFFEYAFVLPARVNRSRRALKSDASTQPTSLTSPARASSGL